jgi:hypothetical protein
MNQENYSHILNIKVISKITNTVINDQQLLEKIKNLFIQKERVFNGVKLVWRKIEWSGMNKYFDLGDLVIDSIFSVDRILIQNVKCVLNQIYIELYSEGLLKNQQIIFKIIKPLTKSIPLIDSVGVFEFE